MKKLFDLKDCSQSEPLSPGPGSTPEEIYEYGNAMAAWFNSCVLELGKIPPPNPPIITVYPVKYEDTKGYVWIKTASSEGVDLKLDFFDIPKELKTSLSSNSESLLIIGIRLSLIDDYSILTLSKEGIKVQKLKRYKVRLSNLLNAISNHAKIPNVDLNTIADDFWDKHKRAIIQVN